MLIRKESPLLFGLVGASPNSRPVDWKAKFQDLYNVIGQFLNDHPNGVLQGDLLVPWIDTDLPKLYDSVNWYINGMDGEPPSSYPGVFNAYVQRFQNDGGQYPPPSTAPTTQPVLRVPYSPGMFPPPVLITPPPPPANTTTGADVSSLVSGLSNTALIGGAVVLAALAFVVGRA